MLTVASAPVHIHAVHIIQLNDWKQVLSIQYTLYIAQHTMDIAYDTLDIAKDTLDISQHLAHHYAHI